ncbi:CaiB/BaiF CoA transferase family protein [Aspergillus alliaceus]|nr:CoA-transferase family III domain-containing protein [Aspergillus alliaceus]KAB8234159.1 CoA-transferase family III domain-containing protein [Aspergillus alliaceus]
MYRRIGPSRPLSEALCRPTRGTRSASTHTSTKGPLSGITVVSLEQAIAAPFCTRHLADLGARVIKVERPGVGDFARNYDTRVNGLASHFVWTNRSKESLALDLKNTRDHGILMRLLGKADVLVQNLAPGASARLGLSHVDLKTKHPSLIVCNISGYGPDGPYRDKKAYDLLIQSEAGMLSVTGTGKEPAKVGVSIADICAGTYAYSNILAALIQRGNDPEKRGCNIDISMLESMIEWMGFPMYYTYHNAPGPTPAGASHAAIYPYGPFETGDGTSVMLGIQNEREWVKFCEKVLSLPDLATDQRFVNNSLRSKNRDALKEIICEVFSSLTSGQVIALLDEAAIANASVNDMQGVWEHPQLKARGRWTEVSTPAGPIPALLPPGLTLGEPGQSSAKMGAVPDVGEHNTAILAELGIDDREE